MSVVPVEIKHRLLTGWAELTFLKRTICAQANHKINSIFKCPLDTSKQKSLVKQSQFVHRQNPTPGVTNVVGEVFSLTLLGMAPPDMWLLLAVTVAVVQMVGFLKAEVVFESLEVEPGMVLELIQVEDKVVLELLQLTGKVVVVVKPVVKPVNFLTKLILLPTEHRIGWWPHRCWW